jgi:hypothetical protein
MKRYPFKFLDAYSKEDSNIFFGRDEEIGALYEMVFQSTILLIYGASGTGKTSLIQCGLASKFESHDWLALPIRRGSNINASFEKALADAGGNLEEAEDMDWLKEVMEEKETATVQKQLSPLAKSFKAVYLNSFRPIYLIFDQFEELFILGAKEEQEQFIKTVKEVLQVEQPVKMIFSIREEYLGHLNAFERAVPQLLRRKLRVEPMNLDKVRQVIKGATSSENSNVHLQTGEVDLITESIFDKIKGNEKTLTIQLPYLQVFLDKFYLDIARDEHRQAEATFTIAALEKIKDIGDVLRNFLDEQVAVIDKKLSLHYKDVAVETIWKILSPFATLEGTKEPISKENLYDRLPEIERNLVDATVVAFINSRILRYSDESDIYEIAHDSLAKRIAEKRSDEEIALLEIKRLIKSQAALKTDARELFSEKQLNFIEPFLAKINLAAEEKTLIEQSYASVARQKEAKKARENEEAERQLILTKQHLLEKNQRYQRRFIRMMGAALVVMIALALWAFNQRQVASANENKANAALKDNEKLQILNAAYELKRFGDSYKDLGKTDFACDSYRAALDTLRNYQNESFYLVLKQQVDACK